MELTVVPPVDETARQALVSALRQTSVVERGWRGYEDSWRRAALLDGVERDDPDSGYALSPRSTRGATRA